MSDKPLNPFARQRFAELDGEGGPTFNSMDHEWRLPYSGLLECHRAMRDELFATMAIKGQASKLDVIEAGRALLQSAYDLTDQEAYLIAFESEGAELVLAVWSSMLYDDDTPMEWTEWAELSLLVNGIDPKAFPRNRVGRMIHALQAVGKTLPLELIGHVKWKQTRESLNEGGVSVMKTIYNGVEIANGG